MKIRKIMAIGTVSALVGTMCFSTGIASPVTLTPAGGQVISRKAALDNHFHAYAGGTKSSSSTLYRGGGKLFAYVDVEGDELTGVTYSWTVYQSREDYKKGNGEETGFTGRTMYFDYFPYNYEVLTCDVSDGYGNSQKVVFYLASKYFKKVDSPNLTIKVGESLELLPILQDYQEDGHSPAAWSVFNQNYYSNEPGKSAPVSGDYTLNAVKPGMELVTVNALERDQETGEYHTVSWLDLMVQVQFKDVTKSSDYWYAPVYWGTNNGIVGGYNDGTFKPANDCNRAQMVTFMWRMAGCPEPATKENPFKDVTDKKAYYYKAMLWGVENGIVGGYKLKDGTHEFRPGGQCTRQQAVTFLWRFAGKPEPSDSESVFTDVKDKSAYFYKAVLWASENGITGGYSDRTFKPTGNCVRKQMVSFLYRYSLYQDNLVTVIGDWWTDPDAEPYSELELAKKEYREQRMAELDYRVVRKSVASWGEFSDGLLGHDIAADDYHADIYVLDQNFVADALKGGMLYDLATLENLNLNDAKWNQTTVQVMSQGDHVYGVSFGDSEPRLGVFFNKRVLKEAGYSEDYIYDLQQSGDWTWDTFSDICAACTRDMNNDGEPDIYAMASGPSDYFQAVVASDGVDWISVDETTGHFVNNTTSDEWVNAMNWGLEMVRNYEMPEPGNADWDWYNYAFIGGHVAMTIGDEYKADIWNANGMYDEWGFVMFPKGPHMDHYVQVVRENVFVIPSSYSREQAEAAAFVLDEYADPLPEGYYSGDETWADNYYPVFRDTRAVDETLAMMRKPENQVVNYATVLGVDMGELIFNPYYGECTPAEASEAYVLKLNELLEEINKKF